MFREAFHYDWHWAWNTGNGDIGNQTPHEIDIANRILGDGPLPRQIRSFGGRFGWNDAGETPSLQVATYELAGVPVVIEVNNLKLSPTRNTIGARDGIRIGVDPASNKIITPDIDPALIRSKSRPEFQVPDFG